MIMVADATNEQCLISNNFHSWTILQRSWDTFQLAIYMIILGCVSMQKTEKLNTVIFVSRLELVDSAKAVVFSPMFCLLVSTKGSFFYS